MTLSWISPSASLLASFIELDAGSPVYTSELTITDSILGDAIVATFSVFSGQIPDNHTLINNGNNTATLTITPTVRELDEYVPEYVRPLDFVYDSDTKGGGNYATYGSAITGGKTFTFTIRATTTDTNGINVTDRTFTVRVDNNWSSDRDTFVKEYFSGDTLTYKGVTYNTPEDYITALKGDGYYV